MTHIHIADSINDNVRMILPPTADGQVSAVHVYTVDGLNNVSGMTFDGTHIHICDSTDDNVRMILPPTADGEAPVVYTYTVSGLNRPTGLTLPPDRKGRFQISADGNVLKVSSGIFDNVVVTPILVNYNTMKPTIIDWNVPGNYEFRENFDFLVALNVPTTGWHANNTFTQIWIEEGTILGMPTPYKWVGLNPPDIHAAVPDDLSGTGWQALATPPNPVTPSSNGFNDDGTEWHGEEGQYFLVRIEVTNEDATGIPQFSLRPDNSLRGPVS